MNEEQVLELINNPETSTVLFGAIEKAGYKAFKSDEFDNMLNTQLKAKEQELYNSATFKAYTGIENDVAEVSGIQKEANEKAFDYVKRVVSHFKGSDAQKEAMLKELQSKAGSDEQSKALIESLKSELSKKDSELSNIRTESDRKLLQYEIKSSLAGVKLNTAIPEFSLKLSVDAVINEVMGSAKRSDDGSLYFVKQDGNMDINTSTLQPKTAQEIISEKLGALGLLEVGKQGKHGIGTEEPKGNLDIGVKDINGKSVVIPSNIKTDAEFTNWLSENKQLYGTAGDKTFIEIYYAWKNKK